MTGTTEIKVSPYHMRKGDVIVAVTSSPNSSIHRSHGWCGWTVADTNYIAKPRYGQFKVWHNMVEVTFTNGETVKLEGFKADYIVERTEDDDEDDFGW